MGDVVRNATGVDLDPEDGMPVFTVVDGIPYSRRRYLAATGVERRKATTADFQAVADRATTKGK